MATYAQIAQKTWTKNREDGTTRQFRLTFEELDGAAADLEIPLVQDIQVIAGDRSDEVNKGIKVHQLQLQLKAVQSAGDLLSKIDGAGYRQLRVTLEDVTNSYELFKGYVIGDQSEFGLYEKVQSLQVKATGQLADLNATAAPDAPNTLHELAQEIATSLDISRELDVYSRVYHSGQALAEDLPQQLRTNLKIAAGGKDDANLLQALNSVLISLGWQAFQDGGRLVFADISERFQNPGTVYRHQSNGDGTYAQSEVDLLIDIDETNALKKPTFKSLPPVLDYTQNHVFNTRENCIFPNQFNVSGAATANQTQGLLREGDLIQVRHYGEMELSNVSEKTSGTLKWGQVRLVNENDAPDLYYDFDNDVWTEDVYWREISFNIDDPVSGTVSDTFPFGENTYVSLAEVPDGVIATLRIEVGNGLTFAEGSGSASINHENVSAPIDEAEASTPIRYAWEQSSDLPVGKNLQGNTYVGDLDAYSEQQTWEYLDGVIWTESSAWIFGAPGDLSTSPLGEAVSDRIANVLLGIRKEYRVVLRDLQRISLLNVFNIKDQQGVDRKALPVMITHDVLRGFYSVTLKGNFNIPDSSNEFYSDNVDESAGTSSTSGSTSGSSGGGSGSGISDHGQLTGLGDDDHPQYFNEVRGDDRYYTKALADQRYLRGDQNENITGEYTFAPPAAQAPFYIGVNGQGQLVNGLNADQLDGYHAAGMRTSFNGTYLDLGGNVVLQGNSDITITPVWNDSANLQYNFNVNFPSYTDQYVDSVSFALDGSGATAKEMQFGYAGSALVNQFDLAALYTDLDGRFAASSHTHSASAITSGELPIVRGGTNATTATQARTNLGVTEYQFNSNTIDFGGNVVLVGGSNVSISTALSDSSQIQYTISAASGTDTWVNGGSFYTDSSGAWTVGLQLTKSGSPTADINMGALDSRYAQTASDIGLGSVWNADIRDYGIGTSGKVVSSNLDTISNGGLYSFGATGSGFPPANADRGGLLHMTRTGSPSAFQLVVDNIGNVFARGGNPSDFSAWRTMWHNGNLTSNSQLSNGAGYYSSGSDPSFGTGSFSGAITIDEGINAINFQRSGSSNYWSLGHSLNGDFSIIRRNTSASEIDRPIIIDGSNGYVGIGDTNPSYTLDVNGTFRSTSNNYAPNHLGTSDRNLKSEEQLLDPMFIIRNSGQLYSYKKEGIEGREVGQFAQDLLHCPDLLGKMPHDKYGEVYTLSGLSVASVAFQGVKEVDSEVQQLKRRVKELEEEVQSLRRAG